MCWNHELFIWIFQLFTKEAEGKHQLMSPSVSSESNFFWKNFLRSLNDGASLTSDPSTLILEISTLNDLTCLTQRLSKPHVKLTFCLKLAIMRQKDGQKWTPPPSPSKRSRCFARWWASWPPPWKKSSKEKKKIRKENSGIVISAGIIESCATSLLNQHHWFLFLFFFQGNIRNEGAGFHQLRGASRREVILKDLDLNRAPQKTEATG